VGPRRLAHDLAKHPAKRRRVGVTHPRRDRARRWRAGGLEQVHRALHAHPVHERVAASVPSAARTRRASVRVRGRRRARQLGEGQLTMEVLAHEPLQRAHRRGRALRETAPARHVTRLRRGARRARGSARRCARAKRPTTRATSASMRSACAEGRARGEHPAGSPPPCARPAQLHRGEPPRERRSSQPPGRGGLAGRRGAPPRRARRSPSTTRRRIAPLRREHERRAAPDARRPAPAERLDLRARWSRTAPARPARRPGAAARGAATRRRGPCVPRRSARARRRPRAPAARAPRAAGSTARARRPPPARPRRRRRGPPPASRRPHPRARDARTWLAGIDRTLALPPLAGGPSRRSPWGA
jgi:hypothetical protein